MEPDYILMFLQFLHNLVGAYVLWNAEIGPISIILFWPTWISIWYVIHKVFIDWPRDYRCWRSGGIGKPPINTDMLCQHLKNKPPN